MSPYLAEFVGTLILILFGNGVVAGAVLKQSKSENSGWVVICTAWGLAVTFAIYAAGSYSGAHINPAVTLALAVNGSFPWQQVPGYCIAQLLGAFTGATIVWIYYYPHWKITPDEDIKRAAFCTSPAIRSPLNNFLCEFIGTMVLIMGLLFIGANQFAEGLNPLVIGALIATIGFSLGGTTGFAINPARDLGPRIAHFILPIPGKGSSDWSYSWVPIMGPLVGGVTGSILYQLLIS